jgi:L-threonylcarbamoyladenylate synthase
MLVNLHTAIELLRAGKVVALPTETVYGLGCLATDAAAIRQIYEIKNRPADNPLICHVADLEMLLKYVETPSPAVLHLIEHLTPGPISFLLQLNSQAGQQLKSATGGRPGVVMRIPEHPVTLELIRQLGAPLAAPSANTSGKVSPTSARMVLDDLGEKVAGVLDGGPCQVGLESTIVDVREADMVRIVRPGVIGRAELQALLKDAFPDTRVMEDGGSGSNQVGETVPGSKYAHYAPDTPVIWIDRAILMKRVPQKDEAVIGLREDVWQLDTNPFGAKIVDLGSLREAPKEVARDLYDHLKSLDRHALKRAWLIRFDPGVGSVGLAVFNRLQKVAIEDSTV